MQIGTAIKALRKRCGFRQKPVCKALHVSTNFLSMVENNKRGISQDKIEILANFLKVPVSYIYVLADDDKSPEATLLRNVVRNYLRMDVECQRVPAVPYSTIASSLPPMVSSSVGANVSV